MANTIKNVLTNLTFQTIGISGRETTEKIEDEALAEIKRIIEEAKPEMYIQTKHYGVSLQTHNLKKLSRPQTEVLEQYHNNLLKALGE